MAGEIGAGVAMVERQGKRREGHEFVGRVVVVTQAIEAEQMVVMSMRMVGEMRRHMVRGVGLEDRVLVVSRQVGARPRLVVRAASRLVCVVVMALLGRLCMMRLSSYQV